MHKTILLCLGTLLCSAGCNAEKLPPFEKWTAYTWYNAKSAPEGTERLFDKRYTEIIAHWGLGNDLSVSALTQSFPHARG